MPTAMLIDGWFERLKRAIEDDGRPAKEISLAAGLGQNYVQQMLKKEQPPKIETLEKLLTALGPKAEAFVRDAIKSTLGAPVAVSGRPAYGGVIQAGAFLAVDDFNQDPEPVPNFVTYYSGLRNVRQYAWKVRGNSMDRSGILDGMWVVGADAGDYAEHHGDIENGELVVVERTRDQGAERELTVKEIRYYRDRYELHPNSSDATHRPIIVPHDLSANANGEEVRVLAVVLASFSDLRRKRR